MTTTEHDAVPAAPVATSEHALASNDTDPVGAEAVPGLESDTVATHEEPEPNVTDPGRHDTDVDVARFVTATFPELELAV